MWRVFALSLGLILAAALLIHVAALHMRVGAGLVNDRALVHMPAAVASGRPV